MKNFVKKLFVAFIGLVTLCMGSGAALFEKSNLVPDVNDTWNVQYRDWETDRKSTRLNSSHSAKSRMPSSA